MAAEDRRRPPTRPESQDASESIDASDIAWGSGEGCASSSRENVDGVSRIASTDPWGEDWLSCESESCGGGVGGRPECRPRSGDVSTIVGGLFSSSGD